MPKVSVILCAYKCKKKVLPTIKSILNQTYHDFELIIIDDASRDGTAEVIADVDDSRIRLIINEKNIGVVSSRNKGLKLASGKYITHCDHDDIWNPKKIEIQIATMDANPNVGLCGTEFNIFVNGQFQITTKAPSYLSKFLHWSLFQDSTFLHSSTIVRSSVIKKHNISYLEGLNFADDWCIYHQYAKVSDIMLLPDALTDYHLHGQNWSIKASDEMNSNGVFFLRKEINLLTDCKYDKQTGKDYFSAIIFGNPCIDSETLLKTGEMMHIIYESFCKKYNPSEDEIDSIKKNIGERWWRLVSTTACVLGLSTLQLFNAPDTPHWVKPSKLTYLKVFLKVLVKRIVRFGENR